MKLREFMGTLLKTFQEHSHSNCFKHTPANISEKFLLFFTFSFFLHFFHNFLQQILPDPCVHLISAKFFCFLYLLF